MGPFHAHQSKLSAWINQKRKDVAPDFGVQVLMGANVCFWHKADIEEVRGKSGHLQTSGHVCF
jgi:hypothetical protein